MSEARTTRSDLLGALAAGLLVVAFCLILLWRDPLLFWNDDYQLSILPVFADVARSWGDGHWPLLSPYSWVCGNLAGEFQYGTFSVFVNAAVIAIWKFPLTFPQQAAALSITHLFVLAMGAFLLARQRALSISLSIFVAVVGALNGWIICWGATDWFGALGAFAWLPWAWWALERSVKVASGARRCFEKDHRQAADAKPGHRKRLTVQSGPLIRAALWPAPFVYLVITGGFPYTVVMLALLIAWLLMKTMWERPHRRESGTGPAPTRDAEVPSPLLAIFPMLIGVAFGVGLAAPAWLAIFDYVHGSAREMQPVSAHWQWIVPWRALPGFIVPAWTVNWADFSTRMLPHAATELASGLVAPAALVAGFIWRPGLIVRRLKWELLLIAFVLLLAMLPTAGLFRWSFRWLPFLHLTLAIAAAHVLQMRPGSPTGSTAFLLLLVTGLGMWMFHASGVYGADLLVVLLLLTTIWVVGEFFVADPKFHEWTPAAATFGVLLATYLCIPPNCGVPKYNLSQELMEATPLDPGRLYLSLYPPPEWNYRAENRPGPVGQIVRPGSTSMWARLRLINGYSPIRPAGIARELDSQIHGEIDPDIARTLLQDTSGALAEIGIDGIIIAREISGEPPPNEWEQVIPNDEGRVYHRRQPPLETVRSVSWLDSRPETKFAVGTVSDILDTRNQVEADVNVPGGGQSALLKFTRPFFHGYVARVNGKILPVDSYRGLFPIVEVPAGTSGRLVLAYRPAWLVYGGALSILCAFVWVGGGLWIALRKK